MFYRTSACRGLAACLALTSTTLAGALPADLGNWSPVVRSKAVKQAAKAGPEALPQLLEALDSENTGLRQSATDVIAAIARRTPNRQSPEWKTVIARLIEMLGKDNDFWARCGAASALKAIETPVAAPALLLAAGDPNPWVAAAAVDAISHMPVKFFDRDTYIATAVKSLGAPRSATRSSAIKMLHAAGPASKPVLPKVEASIKTLSNDSMFADRPRIDAIQWISKYDKRKAAALANDLMLEERWGAKGRYQKLVPFLQKLGPDAAPAKAGLRRAAADKRNKPLANMATSILEKL